MSDYFDRFEQAIDTAMVRGAHEPWHRRIRRGAGRRRVAALCVSLGVLAPALATTGWLPLRETSGRHLTVCSITTQSARHAPLVDASLPKWLPAGGS